MIDDRNTVTNTHARTGLPHDGTSPSVHKNGTDDDVSQSSGDAIAGKYERLHNRLDCNTTDSSSSSSSGSGSGSGISNSNSNSNSHVRQDQQQQQAQPRIPSSSPKARHRKGGGRQTPSSLSKSQSKSKLEMRKKQNAAADKSASTPKFSRTQFLTTCRKHVYSMADLEILNLLNAPVWIFDGKYKCIRYGNQAACKFWSAKHMEELMSRDYASDMSETTNRSNIAWLDRFSKHPTAQDTLMWMFHPTHGNNPGARSCCMNISGVYIPHPDDPAQPHLCLLVVLESVRETTDVGAEAAEAAKAIVKDDENDSATAQASSSAHDRNSDGDEDEIKPSHGTKQDTRQDRRKSTVTETSQHARAESPRRRPKQAIENTAAASIRRMETLRHLPVVARRFDMTGGFMDQNQEAFALFGEPTEHNPDSETSQDEDLENGDTRNASTAGGGNRNNASNREDDDPQHDDSPTDDETDGCGNSSSDNASTNEGENPLRPSGASQLTAKRQRRSHKSRRREGRMKRQQNEDSADPMAETNRIQKHRRRRRESRRNKQLESQQQTHAAPANEAKDPIKDASTSSTWSLDTMPESVETGDQEQAGKKEGANLDQSCAGEASKLRNDPAVTNHDGSNGDTVRRRPSIESSISACSSCSWTSASLDSDDPLDHTDGDDTGEYDSDIEEYSDDGDSSDEEEDEEEEEEKPCDFVAQFIDHDKGQQILQEVVDSKGQHDVSSEAQLQTIEGIKWFSIKIRQVKDPVTSQSVMIYSARDISDIMQAAKDEADRQNMRKSEFFAVMAHEIRTPLHQVVGFIELLASTPLNIEQTDFVTMLQSSTNALMAIINDLLDFTKLEAGKMKLETIPFEVRNVLDGSVAAVLPQAEDRGLELKCDIGRGIPVKLLGDPNRLRQIVLNMLTNAIKFTSNGSVTTSVRLIHVMTDVNAHANTETKNGDAMNDNSTQGAAATAVVNSMSGNNSVVIGAGDKTNANTNDDNGDAVEASLMLDGEKGRRSPRRSLSGSRSRRKNRGTQSASSHSRSQSQMARKSKTGKSIKTGKNNTKTGKKKSKNGVKAMPQTNREQVVLRFSITDTGIGMTPDQCERIFNAYQQADASVARNFGGTGLGLAICKSLVKGMGGAIGVDSAPGEGTTFWFEIPYKRHVNTRCAATGMSVGSVVGDGLDDVIHDAIHDAIHDDVIDNGDGDDDAVVAQDDVDGADRDPSQGVHLDDDHDVRNVVVSADQIGHPHTIIQVPKQGSASRRYTDDDGDDDQGGDTDRDREDGNGTRKGVSNSVIVKSDQPQALSQPLSRPPADPQARPQPSAPTQAPAPKKPKTDELRILVAEDNKINQKVIRNMLKRLGHVVTIVENGEQAVAQAFGTTDVDDIAMLDGNNTDANANDGTCAANGSMGRPPFDIVLMDWQMPVMDGIDATKEIRTRGLSERDLPIVGLTASIQSIDWGHIGMNDCLKKPVRMADLKTSLLKNARKGLS